MISTTEMAAATSLPEPFFQLCVDAGYLQPDKHARDTAMFTAFWARPKGRKRLTRPETIREMTMKVLVEAGVDDAYENKTFARDMVAALSGEGTFAERPPEPEEVPDLIEVLTEVITQVHEDLAAETEKPEPEDEADSTGELSFSPDDIRRAGEPIEPETTSVSTIDGGASEAETDTDSIAVDDGKEVETDD